MRQSYDAIVVGSGFGVGIAVYRLAEAGKYRRLLDGSIVPTALGVNPSKTIAALADRGVDSFLTS
jgi:choline dehydrogenase-like flavoprotein